MKVFEIRKQIAEKRKTAEALLNTVAKEGRAMSDDEASLFEDLKAGIASLNDLVAKFESIEAGEAPAEEASDDAAPADEPRSRVYKKDLGKFSPGAPAVHTEKRTYSLMRAANQIVEYGHLRDGMEKELSDEISLRNKKKPSSFYYPTGAEFRALTTSTGTGGIATILDADYIEYLRNKCVVLGLGAKIMNNMVGNFNMSRQSGTTTAYWVTEGNSPTASNPQLETVPFVAKTLGAYTDVTRKFLKLSSIDGEALVKQDLFDMLAVELDRVAINGSGSGAEPTGILQNTGCPTVTIASDTNGAALDWNSIVALEKTVAQANAMLNDATCAYIGNAQVRASGKTIVKASNTAAKFLLDDDGKMNGYQFESTQQVPSNLTKGSGSGLSALIFGDWSQLVYAVWGSGLDVEIDPYTLSNSGGVRIVALQDVDLNLRHAPSFAKVVSIVA